MIKIPNQFRLPPLKALQAFEASARLQSFKIAADELFVTPAAVSHQIRILEDHLGLKLFERESNGIVLSDNGQLLYPKIKNAFQLIHESVAELKSRNSVKRIKLTAGPAFTSRWLATHLSEFLKLQLSISIEMDASLSILDFRKNDIDIAIRFGKILDLDNVSNLPLVEDAIIPVVSPSFIKKLGRALTPNDLADCEIIHDKSLSMVKPESPGWRQWFDLAGMSEFDANRGLVFNHGDHAIQATIDGAGVGLVRVILATTDIKLGRLIIPFGPMIPSGLSFSILTRTETSKKAEIDLFVDWLVEVMKRDIQAISELENGDAITSLLKI